jgi:hypothetical protein
VAHLLGHRFALHRVESSLSTSRSARWFVDKEGETRHPVLGLRHPCRRRRISSNSEAAHSAISVGL